MMALHAVALGLFFTSLAVATQTLQSPRRAVMVDAYHGEQDMSEEQEHTPFPHDCEDCDGRGEVLPHWSLDHADAVPCWCAEAEEAFTPRRRE